MYIMQSFPPTVILRHHKENLKKCSLRGLEGVKDFHFYTYPKSILPSLVGYTMLTLEAPVLSLEDAGQGLFILDSTWRYAEKMLKFVERHADLPKRSLPPHFRTAYPRRQEDCVDPARGLASIEAIYVAYTLLGRDTTQVLSHYHWKEDFLKVNGFEKKS
ncbi:hypothetical protein DB42_AY00160 [Neochlamydia sp. EPS4]|nr:hypothetical protein DB42_AY00160 [Neochlamydia sp. EPS4]